MAVVSTGCIDSQVVALQHACIGGVVLGIAQSCMMAPVIVTEFFGIAVSPSSIP
jgi:hypothetical protein